MENFYKILGVNSSATLEEIRRAYRILARRYHPDVNPGKSSEEKFKAIAQAYDTLSDAEKRRNYDIEFDTNIKFTGSAAEQAYRRAASAAMHAEAKRKFNEAKFQNFGKVRVESPEPPPIKPQTPQKKKANRQEFDRFVGAFKVKLHDLTKSASKWLNRKQAKLKDLGNRVSRVSVVEVSVTMHDALYGGKKAVEFSEPEGTRKVSVKIPPGIRTGSVLRLRSPQAPGEDLVVILRVAAHPLVSILPKGVVIEIPITINEAISGANLTVPTLDEPLSLKIPAGSQSGNEIRVKERGVQQRDGSRGDLFYRLMVRVPEASQAVGLTEKGGEIERYYGVPVRSGFPKSLMEV